MSGDGGGVAAAVAGLRAELGGLRAEVGALRDDVRQAITAGGGQADGVRSALEERMAVLEDTIDTLNERLEARASDGIVGTTHRIDAMAVSVRDALAELGSAVDRSLGSLGGSLATVMSDARLDGAVLGELRDLVGRMEQASGSGNSLVEEEIAALRVDLADALEEARDRVGSSVERRHAETTTALDEVRGLLGYLAERDRLLEAERMRVRHDVLDEFAEGLTAQERRRLSDKLGDAVARRRDVRDAERWRTADGSRGLPETPAPPDLSVYDPAPAPLPAPPPKPAPRKPTAEAAPVKSAPSKAAKPATKAAPAARRRRAGVDAVPDVPSPEVALDAAAPSPKVPVADD